MADRYSFTTDLNDTATLVRIVDEADPKKNFIVVNLSSTIEDAAGLVLIVKRDTLLGLADKYPNEFIAGNFLGDIALADDAGEVETAGNYFIFHGEGTRADTKHEEEVLTYEINRLNNLLNDRVIRATVTSY